MSAGSKISFWPVRVCVAQSSPRGFMSNLPTGNLKSSTVPANPNWPGYWHFWQTYCIYVQAQKSSFGGSVALWPSLDGGGGMPTHPRVFGRSQMLYPIKNGQCTSTFDSCTQNVSLIFELFCNFSCCCWLRGDIRFSYSLLSTFQFSFLRVFFLSVCL